MVDYKNLPRQRGISLNPMFESNPRQFAKTRCDSANNAVDNAMKRLGEFVQVYIDEDTTVEKVMTDALEVFKFCNENGITVDDLINMQSNESILQLGLGRYAGYIVSAIVIMNALSGLSDALISLKRSV